MADKKFECPSCGRNDYEGDLMICPHCEDEE